MNKKIIHHFQKTWMDYDRWYDVHPALCQSELAALKKVVPSGAGLEIGVGTGRVAAPLGVRFGLDPAINMLWLAKKRGIRVVQGLGESLPFEDQSFDFVQIVFVVEFVDNLLLFLREKEILDILEKIGMEFQEACQTLFHPPPDISHKENPRRGCGRGGFVALIAPIKQ
jgi:ubiquinone/menaquinone biosynthesis C-methylase UbiE